MVFVNGRPLRIDAKDFKARFGCYFPKLLAPDKEQIITDAIDSVYTMFTGVEDLWSSLDEETFFKKTRQCFGFLTAWYLADMFPLLSSGIQSMGGLPVTSKSIGGVKLTFADISQAGKNPRFRDNLAFLKTNTMGVQAYNMIKTSSKMQFLKGGNHR